VRAAKIAMSMVGAVVFIACSSEGNTGGKHIDCTGGGTDQECACYWDTQTAAGFEGACPADADTAVCVVCGICYTNKYQCNQSPAGDICRCTFGPDPFLPPDFQPVSGCASTDAHPNCAVFPGGSCTCGTEMAGSGSTPLSVCSAAVYAEAHVSKCSEGAVEVASCDDASVYDVQYESPPDGPPNEHLCDFPMTTSATAGSSTGAGGPMCPSDGNDDCDEDAECCSGTCALTSSGNTSKNCTLPCTENADCSSTASWTHNINPSFGCNFQTGYCF